jgi:hypothetical protein
VAMIALAGAAPGAGALLIQASAVPVRLAATFAQSEIVFRMRLAHWVVARIGCGSPTSMGVGNPDGGREEAGAVARRRWRASSPPGHADPATHTPAAPEDHSSAGLVYIGLGVLGRQMAGSFEVRIRGG